MWRNINSLGRELVIGHMSISNTSKIRKYIFLIARGCLHSTTVHSFHGYSRWESTNSIYVLQLVPSNETAIYHTLIKYRYVWYQFLFIMLCYAILEHFNLLLYEWRKILAFTNFFQPKLKQLLRPHTSDVMITNEELKHSLHHRIKFMSVV